MRRSPELKRILAYELPDGKLEESRDYHLANKRSRWKLERSYSEDWLKRWDAEQGRISELERLAQDLEDRSDDISDKEFEIEYERIKAALREVRERVRDVSSRRDYTVNFHRIEEIGSLRELCEKFPIQFIPRKQEIGRLLALARQMHVERVAKGHAEPDEPIRVVDVGGANGALGRLMTDLARENGIAIEFVVVDAHLATVSRAKESYADDPALRFVEKFSDEFVASEYADHPIIRPLLARRMEAISWERKREADLKIVLDHACAKRAARLMDREGVQKLLGILKKDFQIDAPDWIENDEDGSSSKFHRFISFSNESDYPIEAANLHFRRDANGRIDAITKKIEQTLLTERSRHDLVINSWMPIGIDFTPEIRELNGAAVVYVIDNNGATGIQEFSVEAGPPRSVGYHDSYQEAEMYRMRAGWTGHSTPEIQAILKAGKRNFREECDTQFGTVYPFRNGFLVQTRLDMADGELDLTPETNGIVVNGEYPWEKEMALTEDTVGKVVKIPPASELNREDYHDFLGYLSRFP